MSRGAGCGRGEQCGAQWLEEAQSMDSHHTETTRSFEGIDWSHPGYTLTDAAA